jgi:hypothetical protein
MKYTDPSGHSVDCGLGDVYCKAGKYTPGGMMLLHEHYRDWRTKGKHGSEREAIYDQLSKEVDDYMRKNPDYDYKNDPYLGFSMGDNRDLRFKNLRQHYWKERLCEASICDSQHFCLDEAEDLRVYYDEGGYVRGPEAWDSSRVSWPGVVLDAVGIPLSLVGLGAFKPTTQGGARILFWTGIVDSGVSVATANHPLKGLFGLGGAVPVAGAFFNFTLLMWDLSEGIYNLPYTPPISR